MKISVIKRLDGNYIVHFPYTRCNYKIDGVISWVEDYTRTRAFDHLPEITTVNDYSGIVYYRHIDDENVRISPAEYTKRKMELQKGHFNNDDEDDESFHWESLEAKTNHFVFINTWVPFKGALEEDGVLIEYDIIEETACKEKYITPLWPYLNRSEQGVRMNQYELKVKVSRLLMDICEELGIERLPDKTSYENTKNMQYSLSDNDGSITYATGFGGYLFTDIFKSDCKLVSRIGSLSECISERNRISDIIRDQLKFKIALCKEKVDPTISQKIISELSNAKKTFNNQKFYAVYDKIKSLLVENAEK